MARRGRVRHRKRGRLEAWRRDSKLQSSAPNGRWAVVLGGGRVVGGVGETAGGFGVGEDCPVQGWVVGCRDGENLTCKIAVGVSTTMERDLAGGGQSCNA